MAVATVIEEQRKVEETALITGSEAIAVACKLADVDVITAYPIRPYDTVMQYVCKLVANGEMDCEYIVAEGEHSQFEIREARFRLRGPRVSWFQRRRLDVCHGSTDCNSRAPHSHDRDGGKSGLGLSWRLWCGAQRRTDGPRFGLAIGLGGQCAGGTGHSFDRLSSGGGQAYLLCPARLVAMVRFSTHSQALVKIPSQEKVNEFLPPYNRWDLLLHPDNPITVAPQGNEDWVMEIRRQTTRPWSGLHDVIMEAYADFERIFGRSYGNPFFEEYMTDDADIVLMGMGTLSISVKVAIRQMRKEGKRVGFVRMRWFRPFAAEELAKSLQRFAAIGVIYRDYSFGSPYLGGVLAGEVRHALYPGPGKKPPVVDFICGLGGREVTVPDVQRMADSVYNAADGKTQPLTQWIGLRE